jgi:outer membrane immunogenic protein
MSVAKFVHRFAVACGILLGTQPVHAADLSGNYYGYKDGPDYLPGPLWQGFYVGASAGGAWTTINAADNAVLLGTPGSVIAIRGLDSARLFGGGQFGYNVQSGNFVYGAEADLGGLDNGANAAFQDPSKPARILTVKSSGGFYGAITGRGGFVLGNALIYAKGGFALFTGDVRVADAYDGIYQNSGTFTGWTVGAGVEYKFSPNLSLKAEYQYFDFSNNNFSCCLAYASGFLADSITANTVKVGFNYAIHSVNYPLN